MRRHRFKGTYLATELKNIIDEKFGGAQAEFARQMGFSKSAVSCYLQGIRVPELHRVDTLVKRLPRTLGARVQYAFLLDHLTTEGAKLVRVEMAVVSPSKAKDTREGEAAGIIPHDVERILAGFRRKLPTDQALQNFLRYYAKSVSMKLDDE